MRCTNHTRMPGRLPIIGLAVILMSPGAWGRETAPVGSLRGLLDLSSVPRVKPWRTHPSGQHGSGRFIQGLRELRSRGARPALRADGR